VWIELLYAERISPALTLFSSARERCQVGRR
jgi:hypothetical protein